MIGCDAVGPVQSTKENKYILAAVDYLTRWPIAQAVPDIDEVTTEQFLFSQVIQYYMVVLNSF